MVRAGDTALREDVPCPFCGLACDDLEIEVGADGLAVRRGGCPISRAAFERALPADSRARLAGEPCARKAAIERAAQILGASRLPLFGGLAADVAGIRGALALADRVGGVVDHGGSAGLFADLTALRDIGMITTTFSEVRNRCDLLLIVGPDPLPLMPRLFERCLPAGPTLFAADGIERRLVRLGPDAAAAPAPSPVQRCSAIPCGADELLPNLAALRATLKGRAPPGATDPALTELAGALRTARYPVIAWAAGMLPPPEADLIGLCLAELVRDLNRAGRAACLPLGGGANVAGAHQACLWQTGQPLRTSFGAGAPRHDPHLFAARRLIEHGEADAVVWTAALDGGPLPPLSPDLPLILLAPPGTERSPEPAVFLPVGRPGIESDGQIFRGDRVVALPLAALRPSDLPSVAATLAEIAEALEGSA